jgi:hypothetical protein
MKLCSWKNILLIVLFAAAGHSAPAASSDASPNTGLSTRQRTHIWYSKPSLPIESAWLEALRPVVQDDGARQDSGAVHLEALRSEIGRFVKALRAHTFIEFSSTIAGPGRQMPKLSDFGRTTVTSRLSGLNLIDPDDSRTPDQLLETYWLYFTHMGQGQSFFVGVVPDDSNLTIHFVTPSSYGSYEPVTFFHYLSAHEMHVGIMGYKPFFEYGDSIEDQLASVGHAEIAVVRLVVVTSKKDFAYPFILEAFWSEKQNAWLPFFDFQLYAMKRPVDVIY